MPSSTAPNTDALKTALKAEYERAEAQIQLLDTLSRFIRQEIDLTLGHQNSEPDSAQNLLPTYQATELLSLVYVPFTQTAEQRLTLSAPHREVSFDFALCLRLERSPNTDEYYLSLLTEQLLRPPLHHTAQQQAAEQQANTVFWTGQSKLITVNTQNLDLQTSKQEEILYELYSLLLPHLGVPLA